MPILVLNILIYILFLYFSIRKYANGGMSLLGTILWTGYAITALFCLINYLRDPSEWKIILWPLLYLVLIVYVWIRPLDNKTDFSGFRMKHSKIYIDFIYVMIICGAINIYYSFGVSWTNYLADSWADVYAEGADTANAANIIDWLAKNINSYGSIPLSIICFYYLTHSEKSYYKRLSVVALVIVFVAVFLETAMKAGRGATLAALVQVMSGSLVFYKTFTKKQKKSFVLVGLFGVGVYLFYNYLVANARYGMSYAGGGEESMIYYMGHSMLTFDYGIADSINKFGWGDYMFKLHQNLYTLGLDPVFGTHALNRFTTFVGSLYFDYGPYVTLLISIAISSIFMCKRKVRNIADAFIICFYFRFVFMGMFVYGRGYYILWLIAFLEYLLLKILVKSKVI